MFRIVRLLGVCVCSVVLVSDGTAQEKSVRPGNNDSFRDPDIKEFIGRFEVESREVFLRRKEILTACEIQPGQTVADVGAGRGLFVASGVDEARKNHPVPAAKEANAATPTLVFPIIPNHGGVLPRPGAVEPPRAGAKVVFDATSDTKPADVNKGLDRVARLLNLYGSGGLKAHDAKITIVLHGEATRSVLNDTAYRARFEVAKNPNLPLIRELQNAGVEVLVCGQALNYKGFPDSEVADGIPIAAAALTVVINKQSDGYSYVPVH